MRSLIKFPSAVVLCTVCLLIAGCGSDGGDASSAEPNPGVVSTPTDQGEGGGTTDTDGGGTDTGGTDTGGTDTGGTDTGGTDTGGTDTGGTDTGGTDTGGTDTGGTDTGGTDTGGTDTGGTDTGGTDTGGTDTGGTDAVQPNIILVITDDQGLDASAQYDLSNDVPNTPVINSLAANGITFDNVWATPSCTTTRAALLTGKHGVNNGITSTPGRLSPDVGTIQQYLQLNAPEYKSAVFGKWHVAGANPDLNHPSDLGIQHYAGNITGNISDYFNWQVTIDGAQQNNNQYHTSAIVDYAADWIADQNTPWFTWLAFSAPHSPFHLPPEEFNTRGLSGTAQDIDSNKRDYYLAALETLDTELGRLLDSLDSDVRENTIVMVIGDNGTPSPVIDRSVYLGSHGKGSLFEGGIHVPLVISGYGVDRTNVRESGLVSIVDFFATIAALTGSDSETMHDGFSLLPSLSAENAIAREYLYTEFLSDSALGSGWTVRSDTHKYLSYTDGSEALYNLVADPDEASNLLPASGSTLEIMQALRNFGLTVRNETSEPEEPVEVIDLTDAFLSSTNGNCADQVNQYSATATDASSGASYDGSMQVSVTSTHCVFTSNGTPNHTFNDGASPFPNAFSTQSVEYRVPLTPVFATDVTPLSLSVDNAILLNGVKIDLLAAGCFGIGNGKVGCNDDAQAWRYDPMFEQNGFRVDSHNAHTQPDGSYHYHGEPNALFDKTGDTVSPVIGFAADGFPIYGSYFEDNGVVRKAVSSYQLKSGQRPSDNNQPGGSYDGSFRDDYEYLEGSGDLDECNGMTINGQYGYFVTDQYPYIVGCFKGTIDDSFRK